MSQAREFVTFVAPDPASAVAEVGAGSGRITFDGGLAERIGQQGQLLVTDPSGPQLQIARQRAQDLGMGWVRFLCAPAEDLPLASGTADLVLGAVFLHFTDPTRALREMARVVRPGGRVAISAPSPFPWTPFWQDVLRPVEEEMQRLDKRMRHWAVPEDEIRDAVVAAGLTVERSETVGPENIEFPSPEITQATVRQIHMVGLMMRGIAGDRVQAAARAVENRIAALWTSYSSQDRRWAGSGLNLVARKPA